MTTRKTQDRLISVTLLVPIVDGVGTFYYPQSLKYTLYETFCICQAIECANNFGKNFYLTCNVSYFQEKDQIYKQNILQTFTAENKIFHFPNKIILNLNQSPEEVQILVKKMQNQKLILDTSFSGNVVLELYGFRV